MKASRELQVSLLRMLNELLPPVVRDARWFSMSLLRLLFGQDAELIADFKERAWTMSDEEIVDVNRRVARHIHTATDLNRACFDEVVARTVGPTVLEVGCGNALLAGTLARHHHVTACDIVINDHLRQRFPDVAFRQADAERLPFADSTFDTVVSTHTIEHVRNLAQAVAELRRVCRRRLILVVPAERPYRYTFNLHLHFFPYPHSLRAALNSPPGSRCIDMGGDLYYEEEVGCDGGDA